MSGIGASRARLRGLGAMREGLRGAGPPGALAALGALLVATACGRSEDASMQSLLARLPDATVVAIPADPAAVRVPGSVQETVVTLAEDRRTTLTVAPGTEVRLPIAVPARSVFSADVAAVPAPETGRGARLEIALETDDRSRRVVAVRQVAGGEIHGRWSPLDADLAPWAGLEGWLTFRNVSTSRTPGPVVAVANPLVLPAAAPARRPTFAQKSPSQARPRVVLLLVIDTLRADRLGVYGGRRGLTPFLDQVAGAGVRFEQVIAESSWTKTSVPSMFTSTVPEAHGVRGVNDTLPPDRPTLAEVMRRAGYFTVGLQTNPWLREASGVARGFMEYRMLSWEGGAPRLHELAVEILDRRQCPLFLYLHYMDVHDPYRPSESYRTLGGRDEDLYDAAVRQLDDELAAFFASVGMRRAPRESLVVIGSDHGEEFAEHGGRFHGGTLYRETLEVPWIVSWPGQVRSGARVGGLTRNLDLAPTIAGLAGAAVPAEFQGTSFAGQVLAGDPAPPAAEGTPEAVAISQVGLNDVAPDKDLVALTTLRWKYVRDRRSGRQELYDRLRDAAEAQDLAGRDPATLALLGDFVEQVLAARRSGPGAPPTEEIDPETIERLKSLGYLGGSPAAPRPPR